MSNEVEIVEKENPGEGSTVVLAFPDVGLVGPIAIRQIIQQMGMEEIGHVTSSNLPPVTAVHGARPTYPIRIYERESITVITSEIPITPNLINSFSESLIEWIEKISAKQVVILGGLAHQNRGEIEKPEIHGVPTDDSMQDLLEKNDLHILQEGFLSGINGVLLRELTKSKIPGLYLMAEAHKNYPDPGAAASVIEALNVLLDLDVDVEELRKKEEEIRVAARDLMRQTQKAMQKSGKDQEEELPIMYG